MAQGLFNLKQQLQGLIQKAWAGSQKTPAVEYLVVAGGGGGGGVAGGGGGGGGLLQGISPITAGSSITVTIGTGGASGGYGATNGSNGTNSVFGSITALGGGGGSYYGSTGLTGGSGGGGGGGAPLQSGGQATSGQGNSGGSGFYDVSHQRASGGGGGAGTIGLNYSSNNPSICGNGGAGIASSISGTVTAYAGGGGGGSNDTYASGARYGAGGVGGGGHGADDTPTISTAGGTNTGGGGGGGGSAAGSTASAGGSGIVIISYPDIYSAPASFGGANSPTASTSGSGSLSFNGSNQALTTNDTANLGSGNFTVEFWVYFNSVSGGTIVSNYNGSGGGYYSVSYSSSYIYWYNWSTSTYVLGTTPPTANTWIHYAIVKNGSTLTLYYNGAVDVSTSDTTNYNGTTNLVVGAQSSSSPLNGYLSNLRIVKGTAIYTSTFTPPTAPLTAVTNTQILMNTVSGAPIVDSSGNGYTSTANSVAPTWNQLSPFATGKGYKNRVYTWTASGSVTF